MLHSWPSRAPGPPVTMVSSATTQTHPPNQATHGPQAPYTEVQCVLCPVLSFMVKGERQAQLTLSPPLPSPVSDGATPLLAASDPLRAITATI